MGILLALFAQGILFLSIALFFTSFFEKLNIDM